MHQCVQRMYVSHILHPQKHHIVILRELKVAKAHEKESSEFELRSSVPWDSNDSNDRDCIRVPLQGHPGENRRWISPPGFLLTVYHSKRHGITKKGLMIGLTHAWLMPDSCNTCGFSSHFESMLRKKEKLGCPAGVSRLLPSNKVLHGVTLFHQPSSPQGDLSEGGPVLMIKQYDLFEDIAIDVQEIAASWRKPIRIGCLAASDV